jgi:hypothetical protein
MSSAASAAMAAENRSSTVVSVEEDAISYEQVARLCKKSAARR